MATPASASTDPPDCLGERGRVIWARAVAILTGMRVLTDADHNALTRYCRQMERWEAAEAFIRAHGETFARKDADGRVLEIVEFPEVGRAQRLSDSLLRIENHFGLTPSARASLKVDDAGSSNGGSGIAKFLGRQA